MVSEYVVAVILWMCCVARPTRVWVERCLTRVIAEILRASGILHGVIELDQLGLIDPYPQDGVCVEPPRDLAEPHAVFDVRPRSLPDEDAPSELRDVERRATGERGTGRSVMQYSSGF